MSAAPLATRCLNLLRQWQKHAEGDWCQLPASGYYGTGYNSWGVQTNQKYLSAMAALAVNGPAASIDPASCDLARERALQALRFSLGSHQAGHAETCTDGTRWGCTWISSLGIERMMHGVYLLRPWLTEADEEALAAMLTTEADWICDEMIRGRDRGVVADPWNSSGRNNPESNLWNGALLWRTATMYPDHPQVDVWREWAHRYLLNSISVAADADDSRVIAGKPIAEWHVGAGFLPHYALDHHGYLNVGYMVICLSNAAMLHFDLKSLGQPAPESLYHHSADLWEVVRKLVFADGRLARIGGDSRVRYAYCQEYLLPTLLYAADVLEEPHARTLAEAQLSLIETEAHAYEDGSFYGERLAWLRAKSPYYATRLESDRACVLGMAAAWHDLARLPAAAPPAALAHDLSGSWCDPDHGAVMVRSSKRLASFAWRAHGYAQGHCQPPSDGHLAEWLYNLGGRIQFMGEEDDFQGGQSPYRRLDSCHIDTLEGGFVTCGRLWEGCNLNVLEGWQGTDSAWHDLAIAALPDDCTMLGLQWCRAGDHRVYTQSVKGLHLNLPNDLYNGFERTLQTAQGHLVLKSPAWDQASAMDDDAPRLGNWVCLPDAWGAIGIYGADQLGLSRRQARRGGRYRSLYTEEICWPLLAETQAWSPGETIMDCGWAVLSAADSAATREVANQCRDLRFEAPSLRGVEAPGQDGHRYALVANFGDEPAALPEQDLELAPGSARLLQLS